MSAARHLSSLAIDALAAGALAPEAAAEAEQHLAGCASCRAEVAAAAAVRDRFVRAVLPRTADAIAARGRRRRLLGRLPWLLAPALAAAAAGLLIARPAARPEADLAVKGTS